MLLKKIFNRLALYARFVYKRTVYFITRPYYAIRTSWPVWFYILNREGRNLIAENPLKLSDVQKRIVNDLKTNGIATANFGELFPDPNLLPALQKYKDGLLGSAQQFSGKAFLRWLWDSFPVLNFSNPFLKLALTDTVLDTVAGYLDVWPKFRVLTLNVTVPVGEEVDPVKSQRWHRDPEDKRMCKVFLYLSDVDETAGPFTYIPGSQFGGPYRNIFPQRPPKGIYPPPGAVEKIIPAEKIRPMTAKAGTIIFCDTSGLHRGGYATKKERVMFTAGFNSSASLWPIQYRYPEGFDANKLGLSPIAKYALANKPVERLTDHHMMK